MVAFVICHELGHYCLAHLHNTTRDMNVFKNQEHCADLYSVQVLIRLGFRCSPAIEFLKLLSKSIDIDYESDTHPSIRRRIELIEQFLYFRDLF